MIYEFDTTDEADAVSALIVYRIYRSKSHRFKIGMDMWGRIERFVKATAKRSRNVAVFIDVFKRRMECDQLNPGELTQQIANVSERDIIQRLYTQTAWIILLVRERIEREKTEKGEAHE